MSTTVILVAMVDQQAAPASSEMWMSHCSDHSTERRVWIGAQDMKSTLGNSIGGTKMVIMLIKDLSPNRLCEVGGTMLVKTLPTFSELMARC